MSLRVGSLFAGYGGIDLGLATILDTETVWFSEFDKAPSKILNHHWPDVPNLGDITQIDWSTVPPVDILTGGFPCQDVSLAGARAGFTETSRSGLWSEFARAIAALKPRLVVIENVRGLLSATASGSLEPDPWGMGNGSTRSVINALGAVLGDLANLGYDAEWCGVRAADAGAPHGRYRIFILAHAQSPGFSGGRFGGGEAADGEVFDFIAGHAGVVAQNADLPTGDQRRQSAPGQAQGGRARTDAGGRSGAPVTNPRGNEPERWGGFGNVGSATSSREVDGEERQRVRDTTGNRGSTAAHPSGERGDEGNHLAGFSREGADRAGVVNKRGSRPGDLEWGVYQPAIERWERVMGPAPAPTNADGKNGSHRLSAAFVEWMQGLPAGHVTNPAIGLTRNEQLKALGNGVVPAQCALALRYLIGRLPA